MPGPNSNNDTDPLGTPLVLAPEDVEHLRHLITAATDPAEPSVRRILNAF